MLPGEAADAARRAELIVGMEALAARGIDCARCEGTCCTFVANSMRVTASEAATVVRWLVADDGAATALATWGPRLEETVRRFALDRPVAGDGRRSFGTRRYTCTFFAVQGRPGCALPPTVKPLGCLGFNPRRAAQTEGGDCGTEPALVSELAASATSAETRVALPIGVLAALREAASEL